MRRRRESDPVVAAGIIILAGFFALAVLLMVAAWSVARAHSWYDKSCCDDRDCERLAPEKVRVTPQGYVTPDGELVPFGEARVSADGDYHWCKYQKDSTRVIHPYREKKCFYAPPGGM